MMVTVLAGLHEPSLSTISFIKGSANTKNHSKILWKKLIEKKTKESLASSKGAQILRITQRSWLKKSKEILGNQIWIEYKPEVQAGFRASFGSFGPVWLH